MRGCEFGFCSLFFGVLFSPPPRAFSLHKNWTSWLKTSVEGRFLSKSSGRGGEEDNRREGGRGWIYCWSTSDIDSCFCVDEKGRVFVSLLDKDL